MRKPSVRWYFSPRVSFGILGKSWRVAEAQLPPQGAHDASAPFIELSESWRHLFLEGLSKGQNVKPHTGESIIVPATEHVHTLYTPWFMEPLHFPFEDELVVVFCFVPQGLMQKF